MLHKKPKRPGDLLGWQINMIYIGGDSYNERAAAVILRVLEKALVIRSAGSEENFVSVMIPYGSLLDMSITDNEGKKTGNLVSGIFDKKTVCSEILVTYTDSGKESTIQLRMSAAPDDKTNSEACKKLLEFVRHCTKLQKK